MKKLSWLASLLCIVIYSSNGMTFESVQGNAFENSCMIPASSPQIFGGDDRPWPWAFAKESIGLEGVWETVTPSCQMYFDISSKPVRSRIIKPGVIEKKLYTVTMVDPFSCQPYAKGKGLENSKTKTVNVIFNEAEKNYPAPNLDLNLPFKQVYIWGYDPDQMKMVSLKSISESTMVTVNFRHKDSQALRTFEIRKVPYSDLQKECQKRKR